MMKGLKTTFLFSIALTLTFAAAAFAQDQKFSDPNVDYTFELPDAKWKMTDKPSPTNPNVEYVYGDRSKGHLEVRKLKTARDAVLSDLIREEEQKQQFKYGFVAGKNEVISGHLSGEIFNFEYVAASRNMSGRFYFLRADPTTVYLLRFDGQEGPLRSIQNQTDSIARTFAVKP